MDETPPSLTGEQQQQVDSTIAGLRNAGLARDILVGATQVLALANAGLNAAWNDEAAEQLYQVKLAALRESGELKTADAFARAALAQARALVQRGRTREEIAAAKLMLERLQRDATATNAPGGTGSTAKKRSSSTGLYVAVGVAVIAVGVAAYFATRPRPNPSTRRRRSR